MLEMLEQNSRTSLIYPLNEELYDYYNFSKKNNL